jgi:transglutaminase-like putative cysteine protease
VISKGTCTYKPTLLALSNQWLTLIHSIRPPLYQMRVFSPAHGQVINIDATPLPEDPDEQVAAVIDLMLGYSDVDGVAPEIRARALAACAQGGGDCLAGNFSDVKNAITFVQDEDTAAPYESWLSGPIPETLVRPVDMLRMQSPQGDCDDFSMSMRARLVALGIPATFVTVAVDPEDPARFSHVYVAADCSTGACGRGYSGRVPLDASHGPAPGWECGQVAPVWRTQEWGGGSGAWWLLAAAAAGAAAWWLLK